MPLRRTVTQVPHKSALALALPLLLAAAPALAHPHVQVTVRTVVVLDQRGEIEALRHAWTFDEAFSAFSTTGLDTNKDGKLDAGELADLAKINVESLTEYAFFSFLKTGAKKTGAKAEFSPVTTYRLEHDGKNLTLHFTLPVSNARLPVKEARLEVYDPTYFVAFDFAKEQPVVIEGGTLACTAEIKPPPPSITSRLSQLGESFFQSMNTTGDTADWAIPVRFLCK
jgi:ABC-type uncharacterized transport system substrate-binding protein